VFAAAQSDGSVWIWDWRSNVSTAAQQSLSFSCKSAGYGLKPAGSTTKRSNHSVECTTLAFGRRMSRHTLIYGQNNRQQETRPCVQFYDAIHQHHFEKYDDFDDSAGVEVSCLDVSTGGGQLVIGSCGDGELRVLDMRDCRQPSAVMCTQEMDMNAVAFSPCESLIAMCGSLSEVLVFDRRYFARPLHTLAHGPPLAIDPGCYTTGVSSVLWTSGVCGVEQLLLTGGSDGCVRVWDVAAGAAAPITCLSTDEGAVTSVCAVEEPTCSNSSSGAGSLPIAGDDCYWYLYGDGDDDREENNNTTAVDYLQRLTMAESGDDADAIGGGNIADSSSSIAFGLDTGRVYLYSLTSAALGGQS
jgi:WD40 repeat protein